MGQGEGGKWDRGREGSGTGGGREVGQGEGGKWDRVRRGREGSGTGGGREVGKGQEEGGRDEEQGSRGYREGEGKGGGRERGWGREGREWREGEERPVQGAGNGQIIQYIICTSYWLTVRLTLPCTKACTSCL